MNKGIAFDTKEIKSNYIKEGQTEFKTAIMSRQNNYKTSNMVQITISPTDFQNSSPRGMPRNQNKQCQASLDQYKLGPGQGLGHQKTTTA